MGPEEERAHLAEEPIFYDAVLGYPEQRERVFIDAGASQGMYSDLAANRFRHVYAIEPHPYNVQRLRSRTAGHPNVTVIPKALGATDGGQMLYECTHFMGHTTHAPGNSVHGPDWIGVQGVTLDTLWEDIQAKGETVGVIKCDIEGAEHFAWRAARRLLADNRAWLWVLLEAHNGVDWNALRTLFTQLGYTFPAKIEHAHHYVIRRAE